MNFIGQIKDLKTNDLLIKKIIDSTNQLGKNKRLNRCKSF